MERDQRNGNRRYYQANRQRELSRVRARRAQTVVFLRDVRRRPCQDCGGSFEPHQMDFDHRDPEEKTFRVTSGAAMLRSRQALLAEIAKCDIVCANCHRLRTQRRHAERRPASRGSSVYLARKRAAWRAHAELLNRLRHVPCADCARSFPPCAMDFDHRRGVTKRVAVTRMIGRAGVEAILEEVAKCDIVCANCHRLRTFTRRAGTATRE